MGCDIHLRIQINKNGKWINDPKSLYVGRYYTLFGLLADVRGYQFDPISQPKGLPTDCPDQISISKDASGNETITMENEWMGEHSFSYLNLKELLTFDWSQKDDIDDEPMSNTLFYKEVVVYMQYLAIKYGGNDKVRVVFGFDS